MHPNDLLISGLVGKRCPLGCKGRDDCKRRPRCGDGHDGKIEDKIRR